ncbi:hypothetical protein [Variovorax sp. HJSM1_2]|uniref:hypothetical protein n=1 Tax=Variovorax sp. HJSM1_2 TaxID=3366263 RepID=UPI003BEBCF2A
MTSFVHTNMSTVHPGVARAESVYAAARELRQGGFDSAKGLSAVLLAAVVAAFMVVADKMVDTWAEGHLFTAWVIMWAVAFAALALSAGTVRRVANRVVAAADGWSRRVAQERADQRLWETAQQVPAVMEDVMAAIARSNVAAPAIARSAVQVPASVASSFSLAKVVAEWQAKNARARADARLWQVAQRDSRVMADLMAAQSRSELATSEVVAAKPAAPAAFKVEKAAVQRDILYTRHPNFAYYA